jgi:hypothetical protein
VRQLSEAPGLLALTGLLFLALALLWTVAGLTYLTVRTLIRARRRP